MFLKKYFEKIKPIWPELLAFFVFFAISCLWLKYHETWFDEAQAWLIARDATSYLNMIKMMGYEGHPALWHTLLFILVKLKLPFFSMRVLHLIIASITAYLILFKSPFKRSIKIPLIFGYFFIFEYNAIGRSYALAVLLIFLIATFYKKRFSNSITYAILLALLANTVLHGTVVAFVILLLFLYELIKDNKDNFKSITKNHVIAVIIITLSFGLVILQLLPPKDLTLNLPWLEVKTPTRPLSAIIGAFYPMPTYESNFWGTKLIIDSINNFVNPLYSWYWYAFVLMFVSSATLLLTLIFFAGKTRILCLYVGLISVLSIIFLVINGGLIRHHGLIFVCFIFCLWLSEYYDKKLGIKHTEFNKKFLDLILLVFITIQITAGAIVGYMDIVKDFSNASRAAKFLKSENLLDSHNFLIGYRNASASLLPYLPAETKFYYFETQNFGSRVIWNKQYENFINLKSNQINGYFKTIIKNNAFSRYILIANRPLDIKKFPLKFHILKYFSPPIVLEESFYIYEIFPTDNPAYRPESDQQ